MTHALEGLRQALLNGASLEALRPVVLTLLLFTVAIWPLACWALQATLTHLKRTGALNFR
jgi:hypothetical protein